MMVSRLISRINLDISNIWSNRESAKLTIYMSNVSTSKIKKKDTKNQRSPNVPDDFHRNYARSRHRLSVY